MSPLSSNQLLALSAAAAAGLLYSRAGWHAPGEFSTFASTTLLALEKRGLLTIAGPYKRRTARLTDAGRIIVSPTPRRPLGEANSGRVTASLSPLHQSTEQSA